MGLTIAKTDQGSPEIFNSLQGEGPTTGIPVTFIRLSRCNLACRWCDTAYTWRFKGDPRPHKDNIAFDRENNQITLDIAKVAKLILDLKPKRLVFTGGEPLLQANKLVELIKNLPKIDIEIETNGTIEPPSNLEKEIIQFNVSPKLAHSGNQQKIAMIPKALATYAKNPRAFFKFVLETPNDIDEVLSVCQRYRIDPQRVFLMAEGTDSEILRERQGWIVTICQLHNFRMSDRLHIHLFGDKRGT